MRSTRISDCPARCSANDLKRFSRLTEKGNDLAMVLLAMQQFGDKWAFDGDGPLQWRHLACGEISAAVACCEKCGEQVRPGDAIPLRGPAFDPVAAPVLGAALDQVAAVFG
jgi:hypothetical protein